MDHDLPALLALVQSRGGSLTVRNLQHAARIYRQSATDARAGLQAIADAGLGYWSNGRTLQLHTNMDIAAGPLNSSIALPPDSDQHSAPSQDNQPQQPITLERMQEEPASLSGTENQPSMTPNVVVSQLVTTDTQQISRGVVTGNTDASDTPNSPKDDDGPPTRPRDRFGFFLPGPVKPRPPEEPAKPAGANGNGDGHLQGLGQIPQSWGVLVDNAALPSEIAWVQSQRLTVVEERPGGPTVVHLDRARQPAPSHAALGWLETSIRSYAKYVDVVAKSLAVVQDEQDQVRRERLALAEIDSLLSGA